ncbi:hypothetical protein Thi970DRAFT_04036 [Thiorhodovibrio frisius]|uniref:Uncharacterized protein n=1 Tax=Thiorhodovibrio frisius TaxID=631362 RepID=H8Z4Z6_9GAMM|nr:hypothetical protein Thi970DRAFT_04036 [Thiorhodovibrio frisius]WPL21144.1 hypothetical protein Thiofri_01254 [Thiorhodovibrio frisius]
MSRAAPDWRKMLSLEPRLRAAQGNQRGFMPFQSGSGEQVIVQSAPIQSKMISCALALARALALAILSQSPLATMRFRMRPRGAMAFCTLSLKTVSLKTLSQTRESEIEY